MNVLKIHHTDFDLQIECASFDMMLSKAMRILGTEALQTQYDWSEGVSSVTYREGLSEQNITAKKENQPPVFFDNTDYAVWVDFNCPPTSAGIKTPIKSTEDSFLYRANKGVLSGFLNYGNDIGKSNLTLSYITNGIRKQFRFTFEVLSCKLDYHTQWKILIEDVETEYRMLALDFLKRTYHTFKQCPEGETSDLIWWNIFKHEQDKFIKACQLILEYPRRKARTNPQYIKADHLKHLTVQQEIEIAESRHNPMHLYRHETYFLSHDTVENRFLKHALVCITQKHNQLAGHVLYLNISDSARSEIYEARKTLCNLCNHPFFRSIGKFTGLSQESFILQRASGYSTVARVYAVLKAAYALKDGLYNLETKDIATLYEIWCFIAMKNIVSKLCDGETNIIHCNRSELNQCFSYNLNTGEQSRILFKKGDIELAELLYNPKTTAIQANGIQ